ncbi:uncharacterized protein LOC144427213 [Styela clava]
MEAFKLLFMFIGFATTVNISVRVQFKGSAVMTSYRKEKTITAENEEELREKLTKTLENALLDKQIDEVVITTEVYHGNKVYSTQVTKFDARTPYVLDDTTFVTTTKGNDNSKAVTSSTTRSTKEDHDVTTTIVLENVFTTRSITSIASTRSFQESTATTENCGLIYKSKCFWAIVYDTKNVTLSVAKSLCENKLANIYDVKHFNLLQDYLRTMIPNEWPVIEVHTGMINEIGHVYSTNDHILSWLNEVWYWLPQYPSGDPTGTTVTVLVHKNPEDADQRVILNVSPSSLSDGAICENER